MERWSDEDQTGGFWWNDRLHIEKTATGSVKQAKKLGKGPGLAVALCERMALYSTPLGRRVIGCAIEVHRHLGPGLLESVYDQCFSRELTLKGVDFIREAPLPVSYKGVELDWGYRVDYLVERQLLVELKAVEKILPVHVSQALTYLKLLGLPQALLINFNVPRLVDGLKSVISK
jgi:GxxExxY protein